MPLKSFMLVASAFHRHYNIDNRVMIVTEEPARPDVYAAMVVNHTVPNISLQLLWDQFGLDAQGAVPPAPLENVPVYQSVVGEDVQNLDLVCLEERMNAPGVARWFSGTPFAITADASCFANALQTKTPDAYKIMTKPLAISKARWDLAVFSGLFHQIPMERDLILPPDRAVGDELWLRALDRVPDRREPDYRQLHLRDFDSLKMSLH